MKPLACLLLCLPLVALAEDIAYAWQWPLDLARADAGAYRVALGSEVYEAAIHPALRDVEVLDAEGRPVAATLFAPASPAAGEERRIALPWFPLPPAAPAGAPQRWRIHTETGPDFRLQRVETELLDAGADAPPLTDLLIDASAVGERVLALEFVWPAEAAPLDARYRLEASDDLQAWRPIRDARLVDLRHAGHHVQQRRIEIGARPARYYRLQPLQAGTRLDIGGVQAVLAPPAGEAALEWVVLSGERNEADGRVHVHFRSPGRYPVESVDIRVGPNSTGEWWLESRDGEDGPWRRRLAPGVAWRMADNGGETRSPPRTLDAVTRDRQWRLVARAPVRDLPELHLGYRPESLVFLAQGAPPYVLVAGSARAHRDEAPVSGLLAAQRERRGEAWQPAEARPGPRAPLRGEAALAPPPRPRDWTAWLLWAVLVLGAAVVGGLALSLLRKSTTP